MEKVERMKLVDENGKTILMTKSEYLKLAQQKGWNVKIPLLCWALCLSFSTVASTVTSQKNVLNRKSPSRRNI